MSSKDDKNSLLTGTVLTSNIYENNIVTVTLYDGNDSNIELASTLTDENGFFSFAVSSGFYTLKFTKLSYLVTTVQKINIESKKLLTLNDIELYAGDVNGDGVINAKDLNTLNQHFGQEAQPGTDNEKYDLNQDGIINALDRSLIEQNINRKDEIIVWNESMSIVSDYEEGYVGKTFSDFRKDIYEYLIQTLSGIITDGDMDIFITLICYIFGDLYERSSKLPWEIDVDKVDDEYLPSLASLIGYPWNVGLTADQQRESIKMYLLIRRYRGTKFGLLNLIRVFGQDVERFYSSSDLRGVELVEYNPNIVKQREPYMYPGDIKIKLPELSSILRDSIDDTRLAGTRIIFSYYIFLGTYQYYLTVDSYAKIIKWFDPEYYGYDPIIKNYGPQHLDTILSTIKEWQISHRVKSAVAQTSSQILVYYKDPWVDGFILNTPGLTNYRGFIEADPTIKADDEFYG